MKVLIPWLSKSGGGKCPPDPSPPNSDGPEYYNVPRLENYVPPETNHPPKTSLNKTALYTIATAMLVQQLLQQLCFSGAMLVQQ